MAAPKPAKVAASQDALTRRGGACVLQGLRRIFHRGRCRREQRVVVSTLSFDGTNPAPATLRQSLFPRDLNSPPPNHPEHPRILGLSSGCIPSKIASYPFCQSSAGAAGFLVSSNRCMRVPWGTPDCPYRHNASKSKLTCSLLGCPAQLRQGPHHTKALPRAGSQSCLFCRDFAAGRRNSTCTGNAPRFAALEGVPKFGRRQAHGVFELDAPGSSTPASLVCRGGAASRRVLRHNVWISRDVPISTGEPQLLLGIFKFGRRQSRSDSKLIQPDIRIPRVQCVGAALIASTPCIVFPRAGIQP
ncbi:hypothetical protein C8R47DRAFT_1199886 [Mycena vitilis]|nr:hypothetical protein C8R47DRAFT_1199886 [Mycena vitilis]